MKISKKIMQLMLIIMIGIVTISLVTPISKAYTQEDIDNLSWGEANLIQLDLGDILSYSYWADGWGMNGQITLGGGTYNPSKEPESIFCIIHGQSVAYEGKATLKYIVDITKDGIRIQESGEDERTISYDSLSDSEKEEVLKMAYILNTKGEHSATATGTFSYKQCAIWANIGSFLDATGVDIHSAAGDLNAPSGHGKSIAEYADTIDYGDYVSNALNYINGSTLSRNKNENDIKTEEYTNGNETYIKVGPFNYSYSGDIESISLTDGNDNAISELQYGKYDGNNFVMSSNYRDIVKTDDDFYILFNKNKGIKEIKNFNINLTASGSFINAYLYLFEADGNYQNVLSTYTNEESIPASDTLELNRELLGDLRVIKVDEDNENIKIPNVEFKVIRNSDNKYLKQNSDGVITFVDNKDEATTFTTGDNGEAYISNVDPGEYTVAEIKNNQSAYPTYPDQKANVQVEACKTVDVKFTNKRIANLKIIKVDEDSGERLKNVKMKVRRDSDQKYININSNGEVNYVDYEYATEFYTDENGEIFIEGITVGHYTVIEIENNNKGYVAEPNQEFGVEVIGNGELTRETVEFTMNNKRKYIDLSGYVWKDIHSEKTTIRNDYYKNDEFDNEDKSFNGITVRLKDKEGNIVKDLDGNPYETKTAELGKYEEIDGGEYLFENVEIERLGDYYVEFEYDGLIYQSVTPHIDANNGSKSSDKVAREILDKKFNEVYSEGKNEVKFNNGQETIYYNETVEHKTSIKDSSACILTANTTDAGYTITYGEQDYKKGTKEIRYINLGLYEKPQADLALAQDLANINVGVNGYWHTYNYGTRTTAGQFNTGDDQKYDAWNVGVKFKNDYTGTYKRAIYKADAEYTNEQDNSRELQVYLTYKIAIKNESSYLTKANSIVDYFDSNYTFVAAGTGIGDQNEITGVLGASKEEKYNDNYKKVTITITTNTEVKPGESNYIYVQFKVGRQTVLDMINSQEEELLYNMAEVNSYTVYKDDNKNTVAAVDKDSVPGNAKVSEVNTYEDDTDAAPPVLLELANARKIQGSVFLDSTSGELKTGEVRQGDGVYDEDSENALAGVKVVLHELNNSIPDKEFTTGEDGNYSFDEYIPGQYTITYTWGDKTYKVQEYKGTIYDSSRNQQNMEWYKDDVDTRKTDAIDNYDTRIKIDNETASITDNTINEHIEKAYSEGNDEKIETTKMDSTTPTMEFGVEYDTTITDGTEDRVEFIVRNVDFGIVERARQQLDMTKRVSAFKIILANGQTLVDATVNEDGTLEGTTNHLTHMGPEENFNGFIKAEVDSELIEGATLEVIYEIKAINNSEVEYMSEDYYKYGKQTGDVVTLTPAAVVDYLDKNLGFETDKNPDWKQITVEDLTNLSAQVLNKENATDYLNSKLILYTEKTATPLRPGENVVVNLNVSKLLTSSEELTFNNDTETVKITKPPYTPENPAPRGSTIKYFPTDSSEEIEITPSTGDNKAYILPITIGVSALVILGAGIFIIKKRIIDNK